MRIQLKQMVVMSAIAGVMGYTALPARAADMPTATTPALEKETITGARSVELPTPPVAPMYFTLPIEVKVVKDTSVTTDTPITDKNSKDIAAWAAAVSACLKEKPALVRQVGEEQVPFDVNGTANGTIKLNANDKPVCPA
ncbi:hypothetical protein ACN4EG_25775 [Alkalinema pantanalense CENA528]|uniref:hypothetical protein n=1 Tax=Alkalinema pantanalense TaxID=1620705 RepID=UPI003D6FA799